MGSMPLVALQGQPMRDPMQSAAEAMQLKALQGQIAMQPGQLEMQQQQIEQQKRQLNDQQARTAALQEWSSVPGSIPQSELPRLILKHGGSADAALKMQSDIVDQQTKLTTLDKDRLANAQAHTQAIGAASQAVLAVSPENRAQAYSLKMKELSQQGIVSPQEAQAPYDESMVKLHASSAMTAQQQIDTELKKRDTAATELKAQTESQKLKAEMPGGSLEDPAKAEMQDWLKKNPSKGPSDFLVWKAKNSPTILQQQMPSGATDPMIDMVGQGRVDLATATQRMQPAAKAKFLSDVNAKYPEYKQSTYGVEKAVETKYTSGNVADQLLAIGTAREHMKTFKNLADALDNGDVQALNKIGNEFGVQFGSDKATNFRLAAQAFGGEVGKAFDGAGVVAGERAEIKQNYEDKLSRGQFRGAIRTVDELLAGKQKAAKDAYDKGKLGKPNFGEDQTAPPKRPSGVPDAAIWDEKSRTWSMP